jgi:hypothetical protein
MQAANESAWQWGPDPLFHSKIAPAANAKSS